MATVTGTLDAPIEAAHEAFRRAGAELGYSLDGAQSTHDVVVLKKGVSAFSWGSDLRVALVSDTAGTRATVHTAETFALTDWGRGRRRGDQAARRRRGSPHLVATAAAQAACSAPR